MKKTNESTGQYGTVRDLHMVSEVKMNESTPRIPRDIFRAPFVDDLISLALSGHQREAFATGSICYAEISDKNIFRFPTHKGKLLHFTAL